MNKNTSFSLNIGLPTIFLVFIVLSLLSLGILSFVSAKADWNLCQKAKEHTNSYYQACNQAEEYLASDQKTTGTKLFSISDLQALQITLTQKNSNYFTLKEWKVILKDDISYNEHLNVIP